MSTRLPRDLWVIPFIALLALLVAGPFWQIDGIPVSTHDVQVHLHRSAAIERSFEQGVYWPRWFPTVYRGLGSPLPHHYSSGFHWLVAVAHRLGLGLDQAFKLVMTAALVLSGLGVFAWLRYAFGRAACLTATALYLLHPALLTRTVYSGGDYPQMLALLLLPVSLWAFTALHARVSGLHWVAAIFSLAALVLSHILIAMVGALVLAAYWLLLAAGYRNTAGLARCAAAAFGAALLSAGYWLPALADLPFVQYENARMRLAHYSEFFLQWWQLFGIQSPVMDSRAGNPLNPFDSFGAASWLALAVGLLSVPFATGKQRRTWCLAGALFSLAALALASPISQFVWEALPALSIFQYPSRFLFIAPIGVLPVAALAVDAWSAQRRWLPALGLLTVQFLVIFPYLFPSHTPMFSPFMPARTLNEEDTLAYEPYANAWGMTSFNEFLVEGADLRVATGENDEPAATRPTRRSPHLAVADLSGQSEPILLRLHYYPSWSAGGRAKLAPGPAGWVQVTELRDPAQPLEIRWNGTTSQRWGERLTLLGFLATLAGTLFIALRRNKGTSAAVDLPLSSPHAAGAMTACLLLFVAARFGFSFASWGPFLRHSPPGELAFSVEGRSTTLGDKETGQVTLLGWSLLSGDTPAPGDTVSVRLYWQAQAELSDDYHTFLHLHTPAIQRSWAVENQGVLRPPTRVWDPQKYYIETMRLRLPEDLPPLTYELVAGMVSSSGERLTVPGSVNDQVHLREMAVTPLRPGYLQSERPLVLAAAATADALRLQGYDLVTSAEQPDHQTLRLFWETGDGATRDWITYIHLTDAEGNLVAQFDGPAFAGLQQTSGWHSDSLYIDSRQLELPADLAPGTYLFRIGLYSFSTGERLPFQPDDGKSPSFENGQLLVPLQSALPDRSSN